MRQRLVVGCMTGTSIDSLDAALVRIDGEGLSIRASLIRAASSPLSHLAPRLRRLADQLPLTAAEITHIASDFAMLHRNLIRRIIAAEDDARPDLVCVHGQTVCHEPPLSWQLFNPAPLACSLNTPVVFDLRSADIARGGQGAPITPIADWILFRHTESRAIINLGGFCNITLLPPSAGTPPLRGGRSDEPAGEAPAQRAEGGADPSHPHQPEIDQIRGRDVCACNQLLDAIARDMLAQPWDTGGAAAMQGTPDPRAIAELAQLLQSQSAGGRSLGTGDELHDWIGAQLGRVRPEDAARAGCEAVARVVAGHVKDADRVVLAGGGTRNAALVRALTEQCPGTVCTSDDLGIPARHREAIAMAILGALCQDRVPITLPQITHVPPRAPIAGAWVYP